jgi:hypothetical protein
LNNRTGEEEQMKSEHWLALALLGAGCAAAQDYPVKPVRIIVGFAPGGPPTSCTSISASRW